VRSADDARRDPRTGPAEKARERNVKEATQGFLITLGLQKESR
jgi:hypothetical protein